MAIRIEEDAWARTRQEFVYLTAGIAEIDVGRARIAHVRTGPASGVDEDMRALAEPAGDRGHVPKRERRQRYVEPLGK